MHRANSDAAAMTDQILEAPAEVDADEGMVILFLPHGRTAYMTPYAAEETSHLLLMAAFRAEGQRLRKS
jgi:thiamine phosphate synthase YjbQ (UPF0047 family)